LEVPAELITRLFAEKQVQLEIQERKYDLRLTLEVATINGAGQKGMRELSKWRQNLHQPNASNNCRRIDKKGSN
jgi:hypothetical protein